MKSLESSLTQTEWRNLIHNPYKVTRSFITRNYIDGAEKKWPNQLVNIYDVRYALDDGVPIAMSGGQCNFRISAEKKDETHYRDAFNTWLSEQGVRFYDPQIPPAVGYNLHIHGKAEKLAAKHSLVDLIQIGTESAGIISGLEIIRDLKNPIARRVVWFTGVKPGQEQFCPPGLENIKNSPAEMMNAYYSEANRAGQTIRDEFMEMLGTDELIRSVEVVENGSSYDMVANPQGQVDIVYQETSYNILRHVENYEKTYKIRPEYLAFTDLLDAYHKGVTGKNILVYFPAFNPDLAKNKPEYWAPKKLDNSNALVVLTKFIDEANNLRSKVIEIARQNMNTTRVVYSLSEAKYAFAYFWNEVHPDRKIQVD